MVLINLSEQGLGLIWPGIFTKRNTRSYMSEALLERTIKVIYIINFSKSTNLKGKNSKFKFKI